ncbi:uncharacterized protein [Palaemon carinicauda]|uniref:uncharacterized protein n=1 Tax=Palaemon carinicauda TaxID=392227 RepID=UPI0035B57D2D
MANFNFKQLSSTVAIVRYKGKKDVDEILQWAWDNYQFDCSSLEPSVKSEEKADDLRAKGNQYYKIKNYEKALELYNLSIVSAPHPVLSNEEVEETDDDPEFAFPRINPSRYGGVALEKCSALGKGFSNRSAIMLDLREYEKCLQDIDLAIEYGYPEELRPKLEERRVKCQNAQIADGASNWSQKDPVFYGLNYALKKNLSTKALKPPVLSDPNPSIPAFSSAAKLSYCPKKGRGMVATRCIKPGEVLGVERAFAIRLDGSLLLTHCSTCSLQCLNPLPCPGCSQVVFCSKSCRARGLSEDHWLDCKILTSVLAHELQARANSYKMLKTFNFSQVKSICSKLRSAQPSLPERLGFDSKGRYSSSSFQSVYHLYEGYGTYTLEDLISECLIAFRLTKLLEFSERYFVDDFNKPVPVNKEDFLETCRMLVSNSVKNDLNSFNTGKGVKIVSLFPAKSLLNHSCDPRMSHTTFGRTSFWYALRPIAVGEELTICYIDCFNIQPRQERRARLLRNQCFVCRCQACEENWPTRRDLPEIKFLCQNCHKPGADKDIHCSDCFLKMRGTIDASKAVELRRKARKVDSALNVLYELEDKIRMNQPISKSEFKCLCEASEVAFEYSVMPSEALVNFMGSVEVCADAGLIEASFSDDCFCMSWNMDKSECSVLVIESSGGAEEEVYGTGPATVADETEIVSAFSATSSGASLLLHPLTQWTSDHQKPLLPKASEMANFNFGIPFSGPILHHYKGEEGLNEIIQSIWDKKKYDSSSLELSVKADDKADMLRLMGNQFYKAKNYGRALESYNQSIMAALHPVLNDEIEETEEDTEFAVPRVNPSRYGGVPLEECTALGKGFANRSAVMLALEDYEKCLQDIDLALEYGYPEDLRPKLEERRLKCQESLRHPGTSNFKTEDIFEMLNSSFQQVSLKKILSTNPWKPPAIKDPNPSIPAFSSSVKLSYCPKKGRRIIATRDIKPGEILGVERAFAVVVYQPQLLMHCSTCTRWCLNPIPCPGCSQVIFCSKSCRTRGLSEDHWLECKILTTVVSRGLEFKALSYKLLKTYSFSQIKSMSNKLKSEKPFRPGHFGFDKKGIYRSSSYQPVYHLHHDLAHYSVEELIVECDRALQLARLLELSERFFVDESGKALRVTKEDILETCKILLNNFARCSQNSIVPFKGPKPLRLEKSATSLFPAESLLKHSCSPVTSHIYVGRDNCWYSLKPIVTGEELTVGNFVNFSLLPKFQRKQHLLLNSGIDCNCQACEENWPTRPHQPDFKWVCVSCNKPFSGECMYCNDCLGKGIPNKTPFELQMISQKVHSALDVLIQMQKKVASKEPISKVEFRRLCEASEVAFKHSVMPCKSLQDFMSLVDACAAACLL